MSDCTCQLSLWIPLEHRHDTSRCLLRGCILSNNHSKNAIDVFSFAKPPRKLHTPAKLTAGTQKWTRMEDDVLVQSGAFQDVPSWELAWTSISLTVWHFWFSMIFPTSHCMEGYLFQTFPGGDWLLPQGDIQAGVGNKILKDNRMRQADRDGDPCGIEDRVKERILIKGFVTIGFPQ